jgi:hypothetical protein
MALIQHARFVYVAAASAAFGIFACSSSKEPIFPEDKAAKTDADTPPSPPKENLPKGTIARTELDQALMRGPGWLLSKVQAEDVLRQNKFVGWRLVSFPADWDGSGLQPGDVITDVNGAPIERPEDFWAVWLLATEATELKFGFERDGKPAVAVVKIHGAPQPETKKMLESGMMAPPPASGGTQPAQGSTNKKRFDTKVIGGGDPIETSD